jgi:hypothetical protein
MLFDKIKQLRSYMSDDFIYDIEMIKDKKECTDLLKTKQKTKLLNRVFRRVLGTSVFANKVKLGRRSENYTHLKS